MKPEIVGRKVRSLLEKLKVNYKILAEQLGISEKELNDRLEGKKEFLVCEVIDITQILELDINTVANVFFNDALEEIEDIKPNKAKL